MSHLLKLLILVLLSLLWGCQKVQPVEKPKNLIPEEKMIDILVDMAKIDAAISINKPEYEKRGAPGKELLFQKYDIDSAQLVNSNAYYASKFRINQRIYETVVERLQTEVDSLHKREEEEQKNKELKKEEESE